MKLLKIKNFKFTGILNNLWEYHNVTDTMIHNSMLGYITLCFYIFFLNLPLHVGGYLKGVSIKIYSIW